MRGAFDKMTVMHPEVVKSALGSGVRNMSQAAATQSVYRYEGLTNREIPKSRQPKRIREGQPGRRVGDFITWKQGRYLESIYVSLGAKLACSETILTSA